MTAFDGQVKHRACKSKTDAQNSVNLTKDNRQRGKEIKIDISSHPQLQRNQVLIQA